MRLCAVGPPRPPGIPEAPCLKGTCFCESARAKREPAGSQAGELSTEQRRRRPGEAGGTQLPLALAHSGQAAVLSWALTSHCSSATHEEPAEFGPASGILGEL